jgi:Sec-independent protein translocase protein TatA
MEFLGVGPAELGFIVLLALILLGPKDMIKAGQTIGRTLRKFVMSPTWQAMRTTGKEIQELPTKLMREAGLEELKEMEKEVRSSTSYDLSAPRSVENQILAGPSAPELDLDQKPQPDAPAAEQNPASNDSSQTPVAS